MSELPGVSRVNASPIGQLLLNIADEFTEMTPQNKLCFAELIMSEIKAAKARDGRKGGIGSNVEITLYGISHIIAVLSYKTTSNRALPSLRRSLYRMFTGNRSKIEIELKDMLKSIQKTHIGELPHSLSSSSESDDDNTPRATPKFTLENLLYRNRYMNMMLTQFDAFSPNTWKLSQNEVDSKGNTRPTYQVHTYITMGDVDDKKMKVSEFEYRVDAHTKERVRRVTAVNSYAFSGMPCDMRCSLDQYENRTAMRVLNQSTSLEVATYTQMLASVLGGSSADFVYSKFSDIMNDIKRFTRYRLKDGSMSHVFYQLLRSTRGRSEIKNILVSQVQCKDGSIKMVNVLDVIRDSILAPIIRPEVIISITDSYQYHMYI